MPEMRGRRARVEASALELLARFARKRSDRRIVEVGRELDPLVAAGPVDRQLLAAHVALALDFDGDARAECRFGAARKSIGNVDDRG